MNSSDGTNNKIGTNNILLSGSKDNLRWEISSVNPSKGTFTLLIRRGDDTRKRKQILETWNNLSLDPNQSSYISKIIGADLSKDSNKNVASIAASAILKDLKLNHFMIITSLIAFILRILLKNFICNFLLMNSLQAIFVLCLNY